MNETYFAQWVEFLGRMIFWDPIQAMGFETGGKVPLVVFWLMCGSVFFTLYMRFANLRFFRHAIQLVRGKYDKPGEAGEISHFQALATALSATVGLGNIAGVAVAISTGGPGATFWMIVAGILGMSSKFVECSLGLKYRVIHSTGEVSGGPMYYIPRAFQKIRLPQLGKVLAALFAILCIGGSLGGGNMLQANQSLAQIGTQIPLANDNRLLFGILLALLVGAVIIGGLRSIARLTEKLVPFMAIFYVCAAMFIIFSHFADLGSIFGIILHDAFTGEAAKGGLLGVMMMGFRRASFSNEAGVGSASIAHAAAKTSRPVKEGIVALLEPFIDTVVICTMTALVIVITGQYTAGNVEGTELTSRAFGSVASWFPYLLTVAVFLFAFSTMISWSYYGLKAWKWLFGDSRMADLSYKIIYLACIILGCTVSLQTVTDFGDMMILGMAFPNVIALYILSPEVRNDLREYVNELKMNP